MLFGEMIARIVDQGEKVNPDIIEKKATDKRLMKYLINRTLIFLHTQITYHF